MRWMTWAVLIAGARDAAADNPDKPAGTVLACSGTTLTTWNRHGERLEKMRETGRVDFEVRIDFVKNRVELDCCLKGGAATIRETVINFNATHYIGDSRRKVEVAGTISRQSGVFRQIATYADEDQHEKYRSSALKLEIDATCERAHPKF